MIGKTVEFVWGFVPPYFRARFVRMFQSKFTVSVVGIVFNSKGEVLVLEHYFRPRNQWGFPGGFIDKYEDPRKALMRELKEEAAIEITNLRLLSIHTIGRHVEIIFSCDTESTPRVASREIKALGWFPVNQLPDVSSAHVKMLRIALEDRHDGGSK